MTETKKRTGRVRVMFTLSMPNAGSWNGKWSGEGRKYFRVRSLKASKVDTLDQYYHYNFGDGWSAGVSVRELNKGERPGKSDEFCGYDWMIDSILDYNEILNDFQRKERILREKSKIYSDEGKESND